MKKILSWATGFLTATGAGVLIANAIQGYMSGQVKLEEAIYQAAIGVIGIGLRRAIYMIGPKSSPEQPDQQPR